MNAAGRVTKDGEWTCGDAMYCMEECPCTIQHETNDKDVYEAVDEELQTNE